MKFPVLFLENGVPKEGLEPTVVIRDRTAGNTPVNGEAASEVGGGWYEYDYGAGDPTHHYVATFDSVTLTGPERYAFGEWIPDHFTSTKAGYVDAAISSRSTLAQADILSDATPFDGAAIAAMYSLVEDIAKLTGHKVTKSGDTITIFEEDGITPWRQYNLADGGRVEV